MALERNRRIALGLKYKISYEAVKGIAFRFSASFDRTLSGSKFRPHTIDLEHLCAIWVSQGGKCALTGFDLSFEKSGTWFSPSIDRMNNKLGYEPGNVQWVCWAVNGMKQTMSVETLGFWCKAIVMHSLAEQADHMSAPDDDPGLDAP